MRKTITLILLFFSILVNSQNNETYVYEHEDINIDLKKDYNKAKFIVNYFFTDGISYGDRHSYEIIVTDSILTLNYKSPNFGSYNYVNYTKQIQLNEEEIDSIKSTIKKANLKQIRKGIAKNDGSMFTREILIINQENIQIIGGQTYGPIGSYRDDISDEIALKEIEKDRLNSSTIGGDYDSVINLLKSYFKNLETIFRDSLKD